MFIAGLFIQQPRCGSNLSVHQQMNEEDVVYIHTHTHPPTHNGILLSCKK